MLVMKRESISILNIYGTPQESFRKFVYFGIVKSGGVQSRALNLDIKLGPIALGVWIIQGKVNRGCRELWAWPKTAI